LVFSKSEPIPASSFFVVVAVAVVFFSFIKQT
jgi:hypothetical protein